MTMAEHYERRGMQQGIEQGIEQNSRDIAMRMLKRGEAIQVIAADTDLTLAEIKKLKEVELT